MPPVDQARILNLPVELSSFIGRRRELAKLKGLLAEYRLVTVTGVGGVGKTRLALRTARDVRRRFGGRVWFVDLTQLHNPVLPASEVHDPDVLACLVVATLGLRQRGGEPAVRQLTSHLADRPGLLVMDNCEHLIPACVPFIDTVLRACPVTRVLATSRECLLIPGEVCYPLSPLPTPDRHRPRESESVALFLERAGAVVPGFAVDDDNADVVAELCRRLDGLPLAIELAATRVRVLRPAQILERLVDRFAVLSRGNHTAPSRQQTLRACVEWSYELCDKPERLLWARLSVFAGGFELDAVEGVCAGECLPAEEVMEVLASLVDKSIVDRADTGTGGRARYRMLQTIRDFGEERLAAAGMLTTLRERHRDWYQQLAERASTERTSHRQAYWIDRTTAEHANVRAAVEFCLGERVQVEAALRLTTSLPWLYWWSPGLTSEGLGWLSRALVQAVTPTSWRVRALLLAGHLAMWLGADGEATRWADEGERLARRLGHGPGIALAGFVRGAIVSLRGDLDATIAADEEALAVLSALPEAEQRQEVTLRIQLLLQLGWATAHTGDYTRARHCYQEALEIAETHAAAVHRMWARWGLGLLSWREGDLMEAEQRVRECLQVAHAAGMPDLYGVAQGLELLAWISAGRSRHRRAASLLGAAHRMRVDLAKPLPAVHDADHDGCVRQARAGLGELGFGKAFESGRAYSTEGALTYALDEAHPPKPPPPGDDAAPLTRREREVAAHVAKGLSNNEVAVALFISRRTVESHVEHILGKLGFTSRTQIAVWIAEHRRTETS